MRKLSLLCTLAILCAYLSSCANPIEATPGDTVSSARSDDPPATSLFEASASSTDPTESTEPTTSVGQITEDPPITNANQSTLIYDRPLDPIDCGTPYVFVDYLQELNRYENNYRKPYAICMVTVNNIDLSQVAQNKSSYFLDLTIDRILDKTSYFTESEGATLTVSGPCRLYLSDDVLHAEYDWGTIPVAEIGERYIVWLHHGENDEDGSYSMGGMSVPIPDDSRLSAEYFEAQYEKMGYDETLKLVSEISLVHYVYNDTVPDALLGIWARWVGYGDSIPANPTLSAEMFRAIEPGTKVADFLVEFGLPYKIELGEGSSTGYYKTVEGDTVIVTVDIDFFKGRPYFEDRILDVSFVTE